ncbi:hypothetical protein HY463_00940 [Candidatus Peregrinibacteria bacterium]|nr:hypothetical protein [Candidatus Peregrinibacteria bacterium]
MAEKRTETDLNRQVLGAANRVKSVDELRSTDTPRFRRIVSEILASASKSLKTPEGFEALEKGIRDQYEPRVELLKRAKLNDGVKIPSAEESINILGETLTHEQVKAVLGMERAMFIFEPQKRFKKFVEAIDANKRLGQIDTHYSPYLQNRFAQMPVSNNVRFGFGEGIPTPKPDSNLVGKKLSEQERLFKAGLPTGVEQMHPRTNALQQLNGVLTDELVDVTTWSPLEDNSTTDRTYLPGGAWYGGQVDFAGAVPEDGSPNARWRSAVMVSGN